MSETADLEAVLRELRQLARVSGELERALGACVECPEFLLDPPYRRRLAVLAEELARCRWPRLAMPRHSVAVAAVVADRRGRVLSIRRRDNGRWETPGGVLEIFEEIQDGVAREVYEETRVTIEPIRLTGVYKNVEHAIVMLVFLARQVAGDPQSTEEAAEAAWLTLEDVQERMLPEHVDRVLDAFATDVPVFRSYGDPSVSTGH